MANTTADDLMKQIAGTTTNEANQHQVIDATNKLAAVVADVINQTESAKAEPKQKLKN